MVGWLIVCATWAAVLWWLCTAKDERVKIALLALWGILTLQALLPLLSL